MKSLLGDLLRPISDRDIYLPEQVIIADKDNSKKAMLYGMAAFALVAYFIFKAK